MVVKSGPKNYCDVTYAYWDDFCFIFIQNIEMNIQNY